MSSRRVVYTAVFGGYESLVEQPIANQSECDFICFTDDPSLVSGTWDVRTVDPLLPLDAARSVRELKIRGNDEILTYDESLWIDNRIVLKCRPEEILDEWLADNEIGLIQHSDRASVADEFAAVLRKRLDEPARVREQYLVVETIDAEVLRETPYWGAIIARRHTAHVAQAMFIWQSHVLRYSRRDQLSFNFALRSAGLSPFVAVEPNRESAVHVWLTTSQLPKDKKARHRGGYVYPLHVHLWDSLTRNRVARHLWWLVKRD